MAEYFVTIIVQREADLGGNPKLNFESSVLVDTETVSGAIEFATSKYPEVKE